MRLYRCVPRERAAAPDAPGGPLGFPRELQGEGRHDAPARYGCLYASEEPVGAVAEQLAPLAGTSLEARDLVRAGLPLALAELRLADEAAVLDLDDPAVLLESGLRPSQVATPARERSQAVARALHAGRPEAVGLRWPSALDPAWANVTLFDRAAGSLELLDVRPLGVQEPLVRRAAAALGLPVVA